MCFIVLAFYGNFLLLNCNQAFADISNKIENGNLLSKIQWIYPSVQSIEGVSPYQAEKRYTKDGWYDKYYRYKTDNYQLTSIKAI